MPDEDLALRQVGPVDLARRVRPRAQLEHHRHQPQPGHRVPHRPPLGGQLAQRGTHEHPQPLVGRPDHPATRHALTHQRPFPRAHYASLRPARSASNPAQLRSARPRDFQDTGRSTTLFRPSPSRRSSRSGTPHSIMIDHRPAAGVCDQCCVTARRSSRSASPQVATQARRQVSIRRISRDSRDQRSSRCATRDHQLRGKGSSPKFPRPLGPTLFEQVKDRAPWGLHVCLVKTGDRMSWSRPVSVHERGTRV